MNIAGRNRNFATLILNPSGGVKDMMKGKVIYQKNGAIFVQVDKNFQICDFRSFDKKKSYTERIGTRIPEGSSLLNTFKGRPLYTAWNSLIEVLTSNERKEEV